MSTNQVVAPESFSCTTLAVMKGKGVTAAKRVQLALQNESYIGVLLHEGIARKAIIEKISEADIAKCQQAVIGGQYARPMATLVAMAEKAFTYTRTNGDVPRSDWMRQGEELKAMTSARGKKAYATWSRLQAESDRVFLERKAARLAAPAPQAA